MAKTLEEVIGFENLTGIIQDPRGGIPDNVIPSGFMDSGNAKRVAGDSSKYTKIEGTRKTARLVQYGSPSVRRELKGITEVPIKLMHTAEHVHHQMSTLTALRQYDNPNLQARGQQEVDRQTAEFRRLFNNLRLASVYSVFVNGQIYFDGDGNLLPNTTGVVTTVDFAVPAGNKNQLDIEGTGDIIDASWATSTTGILEHIGNIIDAIERLTGYTIMHAFYGKNILGYLLANDDVQQLLKADQQLASSFRQRQIPDGFAELNWHRSTRAFYVDSDDAKQVFWGDDTVVFTPDPSPEWWEWQEGSYEVPSMVGIVGADASAALSNFSTVHGMFSYAKVKDDPPSIKHVAGDTFLPTLKVPGALAIADVTP